MHINQSFILLLIWILTLGNYSLMKTKRYKKNQTSVFVSKPKNNYKTRNTSKGILLEAHKSVFKKFYICSLNIYYSKIDKTG